MKKVIVTGSEGLIGRGVCRHLKGRGYAVIKCDLKLGHDLTDEAFVRKWFKKNRAPYLVNLFALNDHVDSKRKNSDIFNVSLDSFNDYLEINLTSLFSVCREFSRNNSKGAIVNFSSTYGVVSPLPYLYENGQKHIGYSVSKAGVIQLSRHLAVHLAPRIRVNCVVPGGVKHSQDQQFIRSYSKVTPLKRMMKQNELNRIVEYLCSEGSSYATGAVFTIDGGWTAW